MIEKINFNELKNAYIEAANKTPSTAYLDDFWMQRFNEVADSNNKLNWDQPCYAGFEHFRIIAGLFAFSFMYVLGGAYKDGWDIILPSLDWYYLVSLIVSFFMGFSWWATFAEYIYCYRFNDKFIAIKKYKNDPDFGYKLARITGWLGSAVCVILGVIFGPMIFIGAGGFALLSFAMTGMKKKYFIMIIPYDSILYIHVNEARNELSLIYIEQDVCNKKDKLIVVEKPACRPMYFNDKNMGNIIEFIKKNASDDLKVIYSTNITEDKDDEEHSLILDEVRKAYPRHDLITIDKRR
ncbi:hypothetical protein [Photobacterium nomapromontoriensis]|uniref:hypothetical protein n=1 Tax=Photobacterium nomapromontoriensis TaxID=2910237 RepID=UPI003D117CE8